MKPKLLLLLIPLTLAGCVATGTSGTPVNTAAISQFKKGVTTRAQVESMMGQPRSSVLNSNGQLMEMWIYAESRMNNTQLFSATSRTDTQMFQAIFENDVLMNWHLSNNTINSHAGF